MDKMRSPYNREQSPDGSIHECLSLSVEEEDLKGMLIDLFSNHWHEITFGPLIQGAAWEIKARSAPTKIGYLDGYLTIVFEESHFHLCIGPHKGTTKNPTPEALARHRRTAKAVLYRKLNRESFPVSWGLRLTNGNGEQQMTVLFPNPFLSPVTGKIVKIPDWSRLALWDKWRKNWAGLDIPDPVDRSAASFSCS